MGYKDNSSDFAMGRRPELKSEEFSLYPILVIEIFTILCLKPLKKCYTVWGHDPRDEFKCNTQNFFACGAPGTKAQRNDE